MSYDLMVFDPTVAPRGRQDFMAWYREVTKWAEDRDYTSPVGLTGNLNAFYESIRDQFPPLNGPDAYVLEDPAAQKPDTRPKGFFPRLFSAFADSPPPRPPVKEAFLTDYSFATSAIYLGFAWSTSGVAYHRVFAAALSAQVGFFNVSADEGEILHDPEQFHDHMGL